MWDKRKELMGLIVVFYGVSLYWTPILSSTALASGLAISEVPRPALLA